MRLRSLHFRSFWAAALLLCWALVLPAVAADLHALTPVDLYQVSTIEALTAGLYGGQCTFGELARHGDFGLGTLDGLDGEMVALDGVFYHASSAGTVRVVRPEEKTPFAQVVFFKGALDLGSVAGLDLDGLKAALAARLPDPSRFYAVRLDGVFASLTARSAPAPKKPWPPLEKALASQQLFPMEQVKGTIVGIYAPAGVPSLAPTGWHFHFLSADRTKGGHVLKAVVAQATARADIVRVLTVAYPGEALPGREPVKPLSPGLE